MLYRIALLLKMFGKQVIGFFQKSSFSGVDFFYVAGTILEKRDGEIFRLFSEVSRRIWH